MVDYSPPISIIKNFFTEEEVTKIWKELDFLNSSDALMSPVETGSARDANGIITKKNRGVFLDELYSHNRRFSNILNLSYKFFDINLLYKLYELNKEYLHILNSNYDSTLISYYEDSDYYKSHHDNSTWTILMYFFKEPKSFTGGNLLITDYNKKIEIENNMVVFLPGYIRHEVDEVVMKKDFLPGHGRYCISKFINYTPNRD